MTPNGSTSLDPCLVTASDRRSQSLVKHIAHREPAAPAFQPARGLERAAREDGAVADGVRQGDRIGGAVEADGVRAGNRSGTRRRHVDGRRVAGALHARLQLQRGARGRILLGRVVQLVNPRAEGWMRAKRRAASSTMS